jgi:hypothetical protein
MDEIVLYNLIAGQINPAKFQVRPDFTIKFLDAGYDTPENRAIVADVIINY